MKTPIAGIIEEFVATQTERKLYTGITGFRNHTQGSQDYIISIKEGDILLQIAEIAERDFAFPISKTEYSSGMYRHFIAKKPGKIPLAVDKNCLSTSIQRKVREQLEINISNSECEMNWLLVYSTSGYPEIECCVRGNKRDSDAVSIVRDYLKNLDQIIFNQIWYTNLVTLPVRIWPFDLAPFSPR